MSLRYKFNKARALLAALSSDERTALDRICSDIRQSQETLLEHAAPAMQQCLHHCEGLCCRNAQVDDIIDLWDLVYILALTPELENTMAARVEREKPFYSADCMFLAGRTGPCLFAASIRPEVCISTFCSGDAGIQREIRDVRRQFKRLTWFFRRRQPRVAIQFLQRPFKITRCGASRPLSKDKAERRS
jgi:hypothetical protein